MTIVPRSGNHFLSLVSHFSFRSGSRRKGNRFHRTERHQECGSYTSHGKEKSLSRILVPTFQPPPSVPKHLFLLLMWEPIGGMIPSAYQLVHSKPILNLQVDQLSCVWDPEVNRRESFWDPRAFSLAAARLNSLFIERNMNPGT